MEKNGRSPNIFIEIEFSLVKYLICFEILLKFKIKARLSIKGSVIVKDFLNRLDTPSHLPLTSGNLYFFEYMSVTDPGHLK